MFNIKGVVLSLLLLISLGSCKNYEYHVSEEIQPYVDEYFEILDDNDIDYKDQDFYVLFDGLIDLTGFVGYAHGMFDSTYVHISIHRAYWSTLSDKQKKILIFHELSHDLFDTLHTWDVFIMQPQMHNRFVAENINWDEAVNELVKYIKDGR